MKEGLLVTITMSALLTLDGRSLSSPIGSRWSLKTGLFQSISIMDTSGESLLYCSASSSTISSAGSISLFLHLRERLSPPIFSGWQSSAAPCILFLSTATVTLGNLRLICSGSSPKSFALPSTVTCWKPRLFLLYPLESTASDAALKPSCSVSSRSSSSVCGVFPVPPTVTLPIAMVGTSALMLFRSPLS